MAGANGVHSSPNSSTNAPNSTTTTNPSGANKSEQLEKKIDQLEKKIAELEAKKASGGSSSPCVGSGAEEDDEEIKRLKKLLEEAKAEFKHSQSTAQNNGQKPGAVVPSGDIATPAPMPAPA